VAGGRDGDNHVIAEQPEQADEGTILPPASQRPWTAQGLTDALAGTPGRLQTSSVANDSVVSRRRARPELEIMTREEAEQAYGLNCAADNKPSRRSSVATVSTVDSEKETSKRLEKELAMTMAKLQELQNGPSSNEMTRSNAILRSAGPSPK
jgi:hypothetical protein